jgi:hypothetical protein
MRRVKFLALTAIAGLGIAASAPRTEAQVSIGIGVAPACPYGYFENPPYGCAPYGYYGPEWFSNGVFIGAGPWFHGPEHFHGYVDNHYHPEHGYRGDIRTMATELVTDGAVRPSISTETSGTMATATDTKNTTNDRRLTTNK